MVHGRGIVGTLKLAAAVAFAVPVAIMGTTFLLGDQQLLGAGFLVLAALMIAAEEYLATPTPSDAATEAAERVAGSVLDDPDDE